MTINSHSSPAVEFKSSTFSVPVLSLASNDLILIEQLLNEKVKLAPEFFKHSPVIVDLYEVNKKQLVLDFDDLVNVVRKAGLFVIGIRSGNELQQTQAIELSIPINTAPMSDAKEIKTSSKTKQKPIKAPTGDEFVADDSTTLMITKPIRSGQRIYSYGDLIVLAQVGAGAEILAEGNIHVYGTLRGRALAGVQGNTEARIFCSDLQAELISIAGNYKISDDIHGAVSNIPVQIYLQKNTLVVKPII
ncbi:MAG: septum site-determining protein MinC [Methylococcales bacterium]|nr:septum site-determining protein MinC [Methylococcales bacterium]MDD5753473.1 septum site-determining protein MinC [Methylococcales bacterium]